MNIQFTMGTIWTLILSALLCLIAPIVFLFRYRKRYDGFLKKPGFSPYILPFPLPFSDVWGDFLC